MSRLLCILCVALFFFTGSQSLYAVTARPGSTEYKQPDGSIISLLLKGDEHIHWATTTDGYTIMTNSAGFYVYAIIDADGNMGFSNVHSHNPGQRTVAEETFLAGQNKGLFFSKSQISQFKQRLKSGGSQDSPLTGGFPTTGTRKLLMILANFNNTTTTYTQTNFNNFMNQSGYNGTGSFRDYYLEVSYGLLTINTTVTTWVVLPHTHDYYGPEAMWGEFAFDAVTAANSQAAVNYAEFDNDVDGIVDGIAIIHQGRGQEESGNYYDIWSHSWELSSAGYTVSQRTFDGVVVDSYTTQPEKNGPTNMGTIGVMCHEFGHNLGAPDFYDTDYSTSGEYEGTGEWDCMAGGSWNGASGTKPAHHNAWTKNYFGWNTLTVLTTAQQVNLRNAQVYPDAVKYNTTTSNEYFIVENRQKTGFDIGIPGHGLIIYHVDGNYITSHMGSNDINASSHQGLYPMAANSTTANGIMTSPGTINSTGCPWPGTTNETTFSDASMPNSKSWAGSNTNYPLTTIAENTTTKEVSFCFITCAGTLSVNPFNQNVPAAPAGNTTFNVTTSGSWTAVSNQSWCTVTPSGSGNGTITANYTENTTASTRTANVTVTVIGLTPVVVTVTQAAAAATLSVTPPSQNVTDPAGQVNFTVTSNSAWAAVSNQSWCTVTPSGTGNGTIVATYTANTSSTPRTASITVTATGATPVTVTVVQSGAAAFLSATPPNQNVPAAPAGNTTFSVTSNISWTATCAETWCTVTPSGTGNGVITATYTENFATSSRVAVINISGSGAGTQSVTVTQNGTSPTLSVSPSNQNVTSPAGSTIFNLTSNSSWMASSDVTWCLVTGSGSGNGTITANYQENTSTAQRIANVTVTVAGLPNQIVTVTQQGTAPSLSVTPADEYVDASEGSIDFTVVSNSIWNVVSDAPWCIVTPSGSGSGVITTMYGGNTTGTDRVANISVTVAGIPPQVVKLHQSHIVGISTPNASGFAIVPNPTPGQFRILSEIREMEVAVIDMSGKTILTRKCNSEAEMVFDLSEAARGSYLIKITFANGTSVHRLIVGK